MCVFILLGKFSPVGRICASDHAVDTVHHHCCSRHCFTHALFVVQAMARLWRVAHFVLNDFLDMPLPNASAAGHSASGWGPAHRGRSQQQGQPTRPSQPPPAGALLTCAVTYSVGRMSTLCCHLDAVCCETALTFACTLQDAFLLLTQVHLRQRMHTAAVPTAGAAAMTWALPPRLSAR